MTPETVEVLSELPNPSRVELVDATSPVASVGDKTRVLQHFQMLRYRWAAHRKLLGEFANG